MTKKLTNEEFVSNVEKETGKEYLFLEKYIDTKTKLKVIHITCKNIYFVSPNKFFMGRRCPICAQKKRAKNLTKKKRTQEEIFVEKISKIDNGNFKLIGRYINYSTEIEFLHISCGRKFLKTPKSFLGNKNCPLCSWESRKNKKKTTDEFKLEMYKKWGNDFLVLGEYKGNKFKIKIKHKCGYEWDVLPSNILKFGCPNCAILSRSKLNSKSDEKFKEEVKKLGGGEYIVLGNYVNQKKKVEILHLSCGHSWFIFPTNFIKGRRCPECSVKSNGEDRMRTYLNSVGIRNYVKNFTIPDCRFNHPLMFDLMIPVSNDINGFFLVEYQGKQHYEPIEYFGGKSSFESQIARDKIKYEYCKNKNIKLVIIPYWEYGNIETILNKELQIV